MAAKQRIYVGTYTDQAVPSAGIYLYEFDPASAKLDLLGAVAQTRNPSYLVLSADRRFLYAVNEFESQNGGGVSAFAVDPVTGGLTFLNDQPTHGQTPCHISLDSTGRWAFVANYTGGSLTVFPIAADGRLSPSSTILQNHGHSVHPNQDAAHVHSTIMDPTHRLVLVSDLGMDQVLVYDFDPVYGKLDVHDPAAISTAAGAGPRHMAFHPNGRYFYQINELNGTIGAYSFASEGGIFTPLQTISTLPADFHGENAAADLHVDPSGRFLYGSNRGYDSLVVYAIDEQSGRLTLVEFVTTNIVWPRNFSLDLTGEYLFVANQKGSTIAIFHVDTRSGRLTPAGDLIQIPFPVCVLPVSGAG